jgi:type VI secretion system protein ImpA
MLDVALFLTESRESPPCGPNLEHDLSFFQIEDAARGKPEQQIGDIVKPGEDPNWSKVVDLAQGFLLRSKDLRIAVLLTRGLVHTEGLPGLAAGLTLIHGLLERYWDHVHPALETDAGGDPTERINALAPLTDPESVVRDLRDADLVASREHGRLQTRHVELALGRLARSATEGTTTVAPLDQIHRQIAAAFGADGTVPAALRQAREQAQAIQGLVADRVGSARAIDLKPLVQPLETLLEVCEAALGTAGAAGEGAGSQSLEANAAPLSGASLATGGEIRSRQDALRLLDLVCNYLERHEPSNPAPLFIRRAQRLMRKDFVEIVKDLLPDSLSQLERLAGGLEKE